MWAFFILCAVTGLLVATHHQKAEEVVPQAPPPPVKRAKPILRLVKAMKRAVSYPVVDTIALGPELTLAPLLDPSKLDDQATKLRAAGKTIEAAKLTKLAASVRAAILTKYQTEPAFRAKVKGK